MNRIKFLHARIPGEPPTLSEVIHRLEKHLRKMREHLPPPEPENAWTDGDDKLSFKDKARIRRRATSFIDHMVSRSGIEHLGDADRKRIMALRGGLSVVTPPTEHRADEIGAILEDEMPWMNRANEAAWLALRRAAARGETGLRLPSMMLVGPPGIGKSHWARRLGELTSQSTEVIDATGEPASFAIVGTQRGWGSAGSGRVLERILADRIANPIVVVDEVEKAGDVRSRSGSPYGLTNALLPLLERSTAEKWNCPYFRVSFDMSWITWVMTANSVAGLTAPLLSRCSPLVMPDIGAEHLLGFARREAAKRNLPEDVTEKVQMVLSSSHGRGTSLRTVVWALDRVEASLSRPMLN